MNNCCGETGIRTLEGLPPTRFRGVRLKPLGHLSIPVECEPLRQLKSHAMNRLHLGAAKYPRNHDSRKRKVPMSQREAKKKVTFRVRCLTPHPNRPILQARDPALARTDVG